MGQSDLIRAMSVLIWAANVHGPLPLEWRMTPMDQFIMVSWLRWIEETRGLSSVMDTSSG